MTFQPGPVLRPRAAHKHCLPTRPLRPYISANNLIEPQDHAQKDPPYELKTQLGFRQVHAPCRTPRDQDSRPRSALLGFHEYATVLHRVYPGAYS